jgi:hypothetical protein
MHCRIVQQRISALRCTETGLSQKKFLADFPRTVNTEYSARQPPTHPIEQQWRRACLWVSPV